MTKESDYDTSARRRRASRSRSRSPRTSRRSRSPAGRRSSSPVDTKPRIREDNSEDNMRSSASGGAGGFDQNRRAVNREIAASEAAKRSQKENRVYVGNLSFQVRWSDLKDFMREAGNVVFAEIMTLPNGMSKGCGVVEFSTREEAERAVRELNDQVLLGRPLFIREDREDEARYGTAAVGGRPGIEDRGERRGDRGDRGSGDRGDRRGGGPGWSGSSYGGAASTKSAPSKQLYVAGLNWEVGWQDLKDLFRQAGDIARADIHFGPDGNPKGSGSVTFTNAQDAQNAIAMFDGAELNGMKLEVKEERFSAPTSGPFGSGIVRSERGGGGFGRSGDRGRGRDRYGPEGPRSSFMAPPSNQIFVKNLPWSTSNEDLVELFQTTGQVDYAEVLHEGGRSKGVGVIQLASIEEAETAIAKFQGYLYGGRSLNIEFNARYRDFTTNPPVQLGEGGYKNGNASQFDQPMES